MALPDVPGGHAAQREPSGDRGVADQGRTLTRTGRRVFSDSITRMQDPWGREIFWIGGGSVEWSGAEDSDFQTVADGYISVTPLHLDLTHRDQLEASADWWQDL